MVTVGMVDRIRVLLSVRGNLSSPSLTQPGHPSVGKCSGCQPVGGVALIAGGDCDRSKTCYDRFRVAYDNLPYISTFALLIIVYLLGCKR